MRSFFLLNFLLVLTCITSAGELPAITPVPVSMKVLAGPGVELTSATVIACDPQFSDQCELLRSQMKAQTGLLPEQVSGKRGSAKVTRIGLVFDGSLPAKDEVYRIRVSEKKISLHARDIRGMVNAIQSFLQMLPIRPSERIVIPALELFDHPRFSYRGMHLDVVRHIFPLEYILKYIDYLTFHKFNTFHWHLTDDQGWRIEMLSYPRLNSIGSWRDSTLIGHFKDTPARYEVARYGGYYTRDQVRTVLEYARVRGITVIPEIDIPGHSRATITAYPAFSTDTSASWGVAYTWGMYNRQNNVLAPNPETFAFLRTVFHEVADLFPSPYIHLGGDECSKMWWKQSPAAQQFMKDKGLKDEFALQTYFIRQVSEALKEKGKKVIGWHEILEGNLEKSTIVMNWGDDAKAVEAAEKGYDVIMTPGKPYYFDHYQSKDPADSLAIHGYNPTEAVYRYEPVPAAVSAKGLQHRIIGGQANVWTEYMAYPSKVDYMVFPRMTALAESLWSQPEKKDYGNFLERLSSGIVPRYRFWNSSWFPDYAKWGKDK